MKFKNITIRVKLILATILTVCLFLSSATLTYHFEKTTADLFTTSMLVKEAELSMLTLRRNEKDFMARLDLKYNEKFQKNYALMLRQLNEISEKTRQHNIDDSGQLARLVTLLEEYQVKFQAYVLQSQTIGLTPDAGLRGELRKTVHEATARIEDASLQLLNGHLLALRRDEKDFLIRLQDKYVERFEQNMMVFNDEINQASISPQEKIILSNLALSYHDSFKSLVTAYQDKGMTPTHGVHGELRNAIKATEQVFGALQGKVKLAVKQASSDTVILSQLMSLLIILSITSALFIISKSITVRLDRVNAHMDEIAKGAGDLTVQLDEDGKDEISKLSHSFNLFVLKLRQMFGDISTISTTLADSSHENSIATTCSSENAQNQLLASQEAHQAMNEMICATNAIAENIMHAANAAELAQQSARGGIEASNETAQSIRDLGEDITQAVVSIENLESNSANIGSVLEVICSIADQTNLLALNAAIEAARAGENGRGFAVVADEVRTLAQRTQESAGQIQELIENLQHGVLSSAAAMKSTSSNVHEGVEKMQKLSDVLVTINDNTAEIFSMNSQIASASQQQSAISDAIKDNIQSIADSATETASSTQQSAVASDEVSKMSQRLNQLISGYSV